MQLTWRRTRFKASMWEISWGASTGATASASAGASVSTFISASSATANALECHGNTETLLHTALQSVDGIRASHSNRTCRVKTSCTTHFDASASSITEETESRMRSASLGLS